LSTISARTQKQRPSPVVLISGLLTDSDGSSVADAIVAKPFEPADLLGAITRLLGAGAAD
jgi:CheY-like chemotaxis protein